MIKKRKLQTGNRIPVILLLILALQCQSTGNRANTQEIVKPAAGSSKTVMRALYIPNHHSRSIKYIKTLVETGKPFGINMLVFDVHTFGSTTLKINQKVLEYLKEEKIYTAARIVCFQDGIGQLPVPAAKIKSLYSLVISAADSGFDEIQLDYIRFQDGAPSYSLKKKYAFIESLLQEFRKITEDRKVKLSADIFGRIVYNHDDLIGQKLENFATYTDVLYPMLYPSHFSLDRQKMSAPGETVKEGSLKGLKRLEGKNVGIQPYIQAFPYNIQYAKVKLDKYVALQIKGVEETGARGWVAWNPNGDYSSVFRAFKIIEEEKASVPK